MSLQRALPWGLAAATLATGLLWRDCVLIASAAVVALQAFHRTMDALAPQTGWAAAARCWLMGGATMAAALILVGAIVAAWFEWWLPANDRGVQTMLALVVIQAVMWARSRASPLLDEAGRIGAWMLTGALVALVAKRLGGVEFAPCLFALAVSGALVLAGWRLARDDASLFLWSGQRR